MLDLQRWIFHSFQLHEFLQHSVRRLPAWLKLLDCSQCHCVQTVHCLRLWPVHLFGLHSYIGCQLCCLPYRQLLPFSDDFDCNSMCARHKLLPFWRFGSHRVQRVRSGNEFGFCVQHHVTGLLHGLCLRQHVFDRNQLCHVFRLRSLRLWPVHLAVLRCFEQRDVHPVSCWQFLRYSNGDNSHGMRFEFLLSSRIHVQRALRSWVLLP